MCAPGDLGYDTAVLGVQIDLTRDDRRHDLAAVSHYRCGGLVTRRFDPEDGGRTVLGCPDPCSHCRSPSVASMPARRSAYSALSQSRAHMTMASSPVSA